MAHPASMSVSQTEIDRTAPTAPHTPATPTSSSPTAAPAAPGTFAPALSHRDAVAMVVVIIVTMFCNGFMVTIMSVALPAVAHAFHVTVAQANWIVLVYTIVAATMITMGARLLHRFGIRAVMVTATALMAAGGIVGVLAADFWAVMGARVLQALAAGLLYPTASTCIMRIAPTDRRAFWLSLNTAFGGIGFAISPFVSGVILTHGGLHLMFLPTAVAGVLCLAANALIMRPIGERDATPAPIDAASVGLAFVGLAAFMFGISELNHALPVALGLMAAGAIVLALFAARQHRLAAPLLNLRPLLTPAFTVGVLLLMFGSLAEHTVRLTVPLFLEGAAGFAASAAGAFMLIPQLAYAGVALVGGKLTDRYGIWPIVPAGFALIAGGLAVVLALSGMHPTIPLLVATFVILAGVGFEIAPNRATALAALPDDELAAGSSISSILVQLASSLSSALLVGYFSTEMAAGVREGLAEAAAYTMGFQHTLVIAIAIEAFMLVVAVVYTRRAAERARRVARGSQPAPTRVR